jgi:hypothetical protein
MTTSKPVFTACVELDDLVAVGRARKDPWRFLGAMAAPFAGEDDALGGALFRHFDNGAARLEDDCFIVIAGRWAYGYSVSVAPGHVEARVTVVLHRTNS